MDQNPVNRCIEVWILTGFLGAGKTSTLNHWLGQPIFKSTSLALIINEFGKLGVDGKQLTPGTYHTFEINKGSVFCICTRTDLLKAFHSIAFDLKPDHVIIEATGIAQPADLEALLSDPSLRDYFRIKVIACVVDAEHFIKTAAFSTPCVSQVQWADTVAINKSDLVPESQIAKLKAILSGLNSDAVIHTISHGALAPAGLQHMTHRPRTHSPVESPPDGIIAVALHTDQTLCKARFMETLSRLSDHVLRLKGNVAFDTGTCFIDVVFDRIDYKEANSRLGQHPTSFTVIGWDIPRDQLISAFESCWHI